MPAVQVLIVERLMRMMILLASDVRLMVFYFVDFVKREDSIEC